MLKIIAVLVLIYIFFRALGVIFKTMLGSTSENRETRYKTTGGKRAQREGNIKVDHDPKKSKGYEGGEYVDYEEVE
jgi:3-deoxy-D-manno-octulosonic-acid transferase